MIPGINFIYLVCTYLPGLPLALVIYYICEDKQIYFTTTKQVDMLSMTYYIMILPLIIGLFIDGTRHTVSWYYQKGSKGEICSKPKWPFWPIIIKDDYVEIEKSSTQEATKAILSRFAIQHQIFEFFFNFGISMLIAYLLFMGYFYTSWEFWEFWLFPVFILLFWLAVMYGKTHITLRGCYRNIRNAYFCVCLLYMEYLCFLCKGYFCHSWELWGLWLLPVFILSIWLAVMDRETHITLRDYYFSISISMFTAYLSYMLYFCPSWKFWLFPVFILSFWLAVMYRRMHITLKSHYLEKKSDKLCGCIQ